MRATRAAAALALAGVLSSPFALWHVAAQEPASSTLLPGPGAALTMAKCSICHDITHVTRSRLSREEWEDNIKVMIARGMPIEPAETAVVVEYLATYYNRDKPPPAPDAVAASAPASTPAERYACVACHGTDKRIVGPSFREIAERYKGDAAAPAKLAAKVRDGGAGAWGAVPMPPHPQIPSGDLDAVIAWVLQQ